MQLEPFAIPNFNLELCWPFFGNFSGGYGRSLLNVMRKQQGTMNYGTEFPLTMGRDFSGTVVEVGRRVTKFKIGDEV